MLLYPFLRYTEAASCQERLAMARRAESAALEVGKKLSIPPPPQRSPVSM